MPEKIEFIKQELELIVELEREELQKFNLLVEETLADIDKTKKELKVEEKIRLNLNFIKYKLRQIHDHIQQIMEFTRPITKDHAIEINHHIKNIFNEILELDNEFLPPIRENLDVLSKTDSAKHMIIEEILAEFQDYKNVIEKLKLMFNVTDMSSDEYKRIESVKLKNIKTRIKE